MDVNKVPEYANKFFATIGEELAKDKPNYVKEDYELPNARVYTQQKNDAEKVKVDPVDILGYVKDIDTSKPSGILAISTRVIKDCFLGIVPQLVNLLQTSVDLATFPVAWGRAQLKLLPKSGDLASIKNWRPISILPLVGKMMERIMHKHMMAHIDSHDLLSKFQYGYRKNRGTGEAVFDFVSDLFKYKDLSHATAACFIDMRKAFDSIDHNLLLLKIQKAGFHHSTLSWLHSYLQNHTIQTTIENTASKEEKLTFGVPQGSVLGPLLFILFLNDITNNIHFSKVIMYADDIVIYSNEKRDRMAIRNLQVDLNRIGQWCDQNLMTINVDKTQCMWFSSPQRAPNLLNLDVSINGKRLKPVSKYTYLGVILDSNLTMVPFLNDTIRKAAASIFKLAKLRYLLTEKASIMIYKQCILPIFDYCCFISDCANVTEIARLQIMQNQGLRICLRVKKRHESVRGLHARCEVPMLEARRKELITSLMYRKAQKQKVVLEEWYTRMNRRMRQDDKIVFFERRYRLQSFTRSPLYRGIKLWNELPPEVQHMENKETFKREIKKRNGTVMKGMKEKYIQELQVRRQ